jgi:hypothetical protein
MWTESAKRSLDGGRLYRHCHAGAIAPSDGAGVAYEATRAEVRSVRMVSRKRARARR